MLERVKDLRGCLAALTLLFIWTGYGFAVGPVELTATVQKSPPQITLNWPSLGNGISIYKSTVIGGYTNGTGSWGTVIATLSGTASSYTDTNVSAGVGYEYRVVAAGISSSNAYIYAGIELPLIENRGRVLLLVDDVFSQDLAFEISRLQRDLAGDGWTVVRRDVSRTNAPSNIKALIKADYAADPANVKAVFLLGHVPVPYSGWINPDGHGSRPSPTDTFYGDMSGIWTDATNHTSANPPYSWWVNRVGDGKYDQNTIPADVNLEVGRVDFYNMPAFGEYGFYEVELMRRYLDKNHDFRSGRFRVANRGATMSTITGNYAQSQFFGRVPRDEIPTDRFFTAFEANDYLWFTKGSGGGAYDYTAGIGATTNFAASPGVKVVFNSWFASYFWEWDVENAFLRAPLAAKGYSLVNLWSDNPCWVLHHMALGKTIGFSTRVSQNNNTYYNLVGYPGLTVYKRGVHLSLMGDPTLRMHVVAPPSNVISSGVGSQVVLQWNASPEPGLLGYNVYRAVSPAGPFARLNGSLITSTSFADENAPAGSRSYMVRAVKLEESSGSGSYINASLGILDEQGPKILGADDIASTKVKVVFDKSLDRASAENPSNYSINNGLIISNAFLQSDGYTVVLGTSSQIDGVGYTLLVNNVADRSTPPRPILTNSQTGYLYSEVRESEVDTNTIALWHLNGGTGDASGHGYTSRLNGNASFAEASPMGATRQCLRVKNVGDFASVAIPASEVFGANSRGFTLEAWIFVNAWKSYGVANSDLVGAYQDYNAFFRYGQGIWDDPHVGKFEVYGATLMSNSVAQALIPGGRWTHIAIAFDGTNKSQVYINKVLKAGPAVAAPNKGGTGPFTITLGNFDGYIDEVRVSRVARNPPFETIVPQNLAAVAVSPYQINLSWASVANDEGFKVERSVSSEGGFVQVGVTRPAATNYNDIGLIGGTKYFYRIRAYTSVANSEYSAKVSASTPPAPLVGTPPKLTARGFNSNGLFVVHIDGETGVPFSLQSSSNFFDWSFIFSTSQGGKIDYVDPVSTNSTIRFYRTAQ